MPIIRHTNSPDAVWTRRPDHETFDYDKIDLVAKGEAKGCVAALIKLAPKRAGFPYHYHTLNEECFFILSGKGFLRTPEGEQEVAAGDSIFFPRGETGAHQLTNSSEIEPLVYLDFDTSHDPEVCFYPDTQKIGIFGENLRQIYYTKDQTKY
jgi:uncharacterized cupin superfamily protein